MTAPLRLIREFRGAPYAFMGKYGANVAGFFWGAGTALQLFFGVAVLSPREIASAVINIASPCSYIFFGHKYWGIVLGAVLGIIGTFLAAYPGLIDGEPGSIFGVAAFALFVSLNIFSLPLTRHFVAATNPVLRETFGHPRRLAGLGPFFFTRLPIIYECITHDHWHLAAVFALWAVGDIALSFSKADIEKRA